MDKKFYAIHDELKEEWDSDEIMFQVNDTCARRAFVDMLKQKTYIADHAENYNLYRMGYIDKGKGIVGELPLRIGNGKELKEVIDAETAEKNGREALNNK